MIPIYCHHNMISTIYMSNHVTQTILELVLLLTCPLGFAKRHTCLHCIQWLTHRHGGQTVSGTGQEAHERLQGLGLGYSNHIRHCLGTKMAPENSSRNSYIKLLGFAIHGVFNCAFYLSGLRVCSKLCQQFPNPEPEYGARAVALQHPSGEHLCRQVPQLKPQLESGASPQKHPST